MITMLTYSKFKKEVSVIKKGAFEISCKLSDDDWDFPGFSDVNGLKEFLRSCPVIDILCVDVTADRGIELSETMRSKNSNMCIIILADGTISPMLYIKPTIMASSLIMRPLTESSVSEIFLDAMRSYLKKYSNGGDGDYFVINNRDGRQLIPYEQIMYFESRSKKVFVDTGGMEYSYYDTLDSLEEKLSGDFVRCHRSFIVSRSHIKQIKLSQNMIILDDGRCIPLSRTYKSVVKGEKL